MHNVCPVSSTTGIITIGHSYTIPIPVIFLISSINKKRNEYNHGKPIVFNLFTSLKK